MTVEGHGIPLSVFMTTQILLPTQRSMSSASVSLAMLLVCFICFMLRRTEGEELGRGGGGHAEARGRGLEAEMRSLGG